MLGEHWLVAWLKIDQKDVLKLMGDCANDRAMTPSLPRRNDAAKRLRGKEYVIAFQMAMDKDHDFEPLTSNSFDEIMLQFHTATLLGSLFCFNFKLPRRSTMQSLLNGH